MTQIKVNINKPDPSPRTIRKYKNYSSFLRTYQELHTPSGIAKMMYRDKTKFSMIVVFLVLILLWILSELDPKDTPQPPLNEPATTSMLINPQYTNILTLSHSR